MLLGHSLTISMVICAALLGGRFFVIFVPLYFHKFFVRWGWYPYFLICLLRASVGNLNLLETCHLTRFLSSKRNSKEVRIDLVMIVMLSLDFKARMNKTLYERYSMASVMCRCSILPSMSCRNCPSIYQQ